ncbi:MAG: M28 family peptidase [Gemmatimonadetes bacterium]|nr:M28 family peptidase [Gemmatimonadota bacterium]MBK7833552.1 M28 family peptidase [Gemmatimonadota bacterium]MBK9407208.1 M28 family peptidase [Gemmatimonadota bacterium]
MTRRSLRPAALAALMAATPLALACHGAGVPAPARTAPDSARLAADVRTLAGDAFAGRLTGTPGNDSARAWIADRFRALALVPLIRPQPCPADCAPGYEQRFVATSAVARRAGLPSEMPTGNVVAMIPGRDPARRGQVVVLGAHFDHLGRAGVNALDPEARDAIRNGADDNASGVATILELARLLKARPPARSVAIVAFTGEELGLLGSAWFVDHAPFALDSVQAMLNFDMVGRLRDDRLMVYGTATATELAAIVDSANIAPAFRIVAIGDGTGPSDHASFYLKNLPVLHFFTDLHDDYHRATDDAERINAAGMARVVGLAERITRTLADRPSRLTFVRGPVTASRMGATTRRGPQPYLGSVPDMGAVETKGLRLSAIRPGSPAEAGGLKEGDVIVELGGKAVTDLYTYTDALFAYAPGDQVEIVVLRAGARVTVRVTLGRRPG